MKYLFPESKDKNSPLKCPSRDDPVQAKCGPAGSLNENHQKSETDKYHYMYILEEGIEILHDISVRIIAGSCDRLISIWMNIFSIFAEEAEE